MLAQSSTMCIFDSLIDFNFPAVSLGACQSNYTRGFHTMSVISLEHFGAWYWVGFKSLFNVCIVRKNQPSGTHTLSWNGHKASFTRRLRTFPHRSVPKSGMLSGWVHTGMIQIAPIRSKKLNAFKSDLKSWTVWNSWVSFQCEQNI